jgi:hypothetical protein
MTNIEGYKILADSLLQTENTRGDYFLNKAKELRIEPTNFFTDLKLLYDEMAKRVNSKDYHIWGEDEQGNKEYLYHSINLFHLTNDVRHCIFLSRDNIANLVLPGLQQFGELIMRDLKRQETEKHGQLIELLKIETEPISINAKNPTFIPETVLIKEWILPDYLSMFTEIERTLFDRGFIDNCYKWEKYKTDLADFICVITSYKYFKPIVKGKKIQDFHKRQFISERYGKGKTGMTETYKKYKPNIELAVIPFSWIEKPK